MSAGSLDAAKLSSGDAGETAMAETAGDERRWSNRRSTVLAGTIVSDRLAGAAMCVVRDLSATGALIELRNSKNNVGDLPEAFALVLVHDNSEVRCEIVWRQPTSIGVRFLGGFKPLPVRAKPKTQSPAKRSWF